MVSTRSSALLVSAVFVLVPPAASAAPKLDKETCDQLKVEQSKFMQSGIVDDLQKGPAWGKANLSPERLREIEHFIMLDEQLKFGCRQVTLTEDVLRAGEAATRLENPNPTPNAAPGEAANKDKAGASALQDAEPRHADRVQQGLAGETPAPAAPKPKPKPEKNSAPAKPKPTDAYRPPAGQAATP